MFDVLFIDFSKFSTRFAGGGQRGSVLLAFSMGAVAALLAGACVAPVVIQVVLFSSNLYATGTTVALALPFVLGLGMAIPWPIAGAGIAALPKPGMWMVRVKQAFGVFILATAAYYGYLAYALFANRWVDPADVASSVQEQLKAGWHSSLAEGLAAAAAREQAGADRRVGDVVQELPDDGQDHARERRSQERAVGLREDQVSGRRSGGAARQGSVAASLRAGPSCIRDPQTQGVTTRESLWLPPSGGSLTESKTCP